jgi:hypothetical protein
MCYYLGIEVKKETFIHLKDLQVQVKDHDLIRPMMSGFEYDTWPIIIPAADGKELELTLAGRTGRQQKKIQYPQRHCRKIAGKPCLSSCCNKKTLPDSGFRFLRMEALYPHRY